MKKKKVSNCSWIDCEKGLAQEILQQEISLQFSHHRNLENDRGTNFQLENLAKQRSSNNHQTQIKQKYSLKGYYKSGTTSPTRFRLKNIESTQQNQSGSSEASTVYKKQIQQRPISFGAYSPKQVIAQPQIKETQTVTTSTVLIPKTKKTITISYVSIEKQNLVTGNNLHSIIMPKNNNLETNTTHRPKILQLSHPEMHHIKQEVKKQSQIFTNRNENIIYETTPMSSKNQIKNNEEELLTTIITNQKENIEKRDRARKTRHYSQMISNNYPNKQQNPSTLNKCQSSKYKQNGQAMKKQIFNSSGIFSQEKQQPSLSQNLSQLDQFQLPQPIFSGGFRKRKKTLQRENKIGKHDQRRMTCFQVPQNLFFQQLQTVQTIKSLQCHTERSYLDIKFMQNFNQIQISKEFHD